MNEQVHNQYRCYHAPLAGPATAMPSAIRPSELAAEEEYPYSDGKVLMDTEPHANSIVAMRNQLQ